MACFLSNISAKYYENLTMLSRVIANNIGDVFLRHSVCRENGNRNEVLDWEWECDGNGKKWE